MMLTEAGVGRSRGVKKFAGRTTKQGSGSRAAAPQVVVVDEWRKNKSTGQVDRALNHVNQLPVTVWVPDGSCYEGSTRYIGGEVVFVESKRLVPVDTEVTIRFTPPNDGLVNRGVAKGTVVWHCLSSDHFKNLKGFGVCLQGRWPQPPGPTGNDGPKEAA